MKRVAFGLMYEKCKPEKSISTLSLLNRHFFTEKKKISSELRIKILENSDVLVTIYSLKYFQYCWKDKRLGKIKMYSVHEKGKINSELIPLLPESFRSTDVNLRC